VENALRSAVAADWLTFSGNGESTLHPEFPRLVREVKRLVKRFRPRLPMALLSNGSTAFDPEVRAALREFDLSVLKLDAGDARNFAAINRPVGGSVDFDRMVGGLRAFEPPGGLTMQTVMFSGNPTNSSGEAYRNWVKTIGAIRPRVLQLYTLDDPVGRMLPVDHSRLAQVSRDLEEYGVEVKTYWEEGA